MAQIRSAIVSMAGCSTALAKVDGTQFESSIMTQLVMQIRPHNYGQQRSVDDAKFNELGVVAYYKVSSDGIVFCAISGRDAGMRLSFSFLDKLQASFSELYGGPDRRETYALTADKCKAFGDTLKKEVKWFNDPLNDKFHQIQHVNQGIIDKMSRNIDLALERGEKVDDLVDKAEVLNTEAVTFRKEARELKVKMCCRHYRVCLGGVLLILAILVFAFFAISKFNIHNQPCSWIFGDGDSPSPTPLPTTAIPTSPSPVPKIPIVVSGDGH